METANEVLKKLNAIFEKVKEVWQKLVEAVKTSLAVFKEAMDEFYNRSNALCAEGFNPCMPDCPVATSCRMTRQRRTASPG